MRTAISIVSAILVLVSAGAILLQNRTPACVKLRAKLDLASDFCEGLGDRMARERCSELSGDPEALGQCVRAILPGAASACMDYLNIEHIKRDYQSACE